MSNTYPENNLGPLAIPGYDTFVASATVATTTLTKINVTTTGVNLGATNADISILSPCITHKVASNLAKFPALNNVIYAQRVWAAEINSLKWAIRNVSQFWNQSGNGQILSTVPTFTSKMGGNLITTSEWNEIKTTLSQFVGVQGSSSLMYRRTSDIITAQFHNELALVYGAIRATCRCNSDCGCNLVCACNYNCGCNYSDRRLKENIRAITGTTASELIYNLNTYSYNYKEDNNRLLPTETVQYGVMAQDLIELGYEEFISTDSDGMFSVNYTMMIPLMINEMQKSRIKNLELEERLSKLEELVNEINSNYKSY